MDLINNRQPHTWVLFLHAVNYIVQFIVYHTTSVVQCTPFENRHAIRLTLRTFITQITLNYGSISVRITLVFKGLRAPSHLGKSNTGFSILILTNGMQSIQVLLKQLVELVPFHDNLLLTI